MIDVFLQSSSVQTDSEEEEEEEEEEEPAAGYLSRDPGPSASRITVLSIHYIVLC